MLDIALRTCTLAVASAFIINAFLRRPDRVAWQAAIVALVVIDLFSATQHHPGTVEARHSDETMALTPPAIVRALLDDSHNQPIARVDGFPRLARQ